MRTIEITKISFDVSKERQEGVIKKLNESYPDLKVEKESDTIHVSGDLRNYKKRSNIIYILSGGEHGTSI